jgi:hypothetical protein
MRENKKILGRLQGFPLHSPEDPENAILKVV